MKQTSEAELALARKLANVKEDTEKRQIDTHDEEQERKLASVQVDAEKRQIDT